MDIPSRPCSPSEASRHASLHALMNCIIKEIAIPDGLVEYQWPDNYQGLPSRYIDIPLHVSWSEELSLFVLVDRKSAIGSQYYCSDVYVKSPRDHVWHSPDFDTLVVMLLDNCRVNETSETGSINSDLSGQVSQSRQVMEDVLRHASLHQDFRPLQDYARSEQGLLFGHPNHPTPKARQWPNLDNAHRHAPEFGGETPLHQFEVPRDGLCVETNRIGASQALAQVADQSHRQSAEYAVISMHPVQAELFRRDERVAALLRDGVIRDLGATGLIARPTASMRTWYIEGHDYFIKGSLNVRITNCVRKNAWYELESTLVVDRIMHHLVQRDDPALAGLCVAREPATLYWAPSEAKGETHTWFREQTGIILRENFCRDQGASRCLLTATLFARDAQLSPLVMPFLGNGDSLEMPDESLILDWFRDYLAVLIQPVLALFFRHGIVMEPHLQNCVLIHDQGRPCQVLLRDFEGVKLTEDKGIDWLAGEGNLHPRVRQSLTYSREQGWNRIAYCLFINHLSEAILALSWQRPALSDALWELVREELVQVREQLDIEPPELDALLDGQPIPCKTNFKLRLMAAADRKAQYVPLPSPWCREVAHV